MSDDPNGALPDEIERRVRHVFDSVPPLAAPDDGLDLLTRRARRIRASRTLSVLAASLVVVAAIIIPLIAFGGIRGRNAIEPAVAPSGAGTLEVTLVLDRDGPLYIEGAIGFVRVETVGGELIRETHGPYGDPVTLRIDVPEGTYRVVSYLRPCSGNCGLLDSPTDSCAATAPVVVSEVTRAIAHVGVEKGCVFMVSGDNPTVQESPGSGEMQVVCDGTSTALPTSVVEARPEGVRILVENRTDRQLSLRVGLSGGATLGMSARPFAQLTDPNGSASILPIPPGEATIACYDLFHGQRAKDAPSAAFDVVDPQDLYVPTTLDCFDVVTGSPSYVPGARGEAGDPVDLARAHFQGLRPTDVVELAGYPEAEDPIVRVVRDGATIATIEYFPAEGGWLKDHVSRCTDADILG